MRVIPERGSGAPGVYRGVRPRGSNADAGNVSLRLPGLRRLAI